MWRMNGEVIGKVKNHTIQVIGRQQVQDIIRKLVILHHIFDASGRAKWGTAWKIKVSELPSYLEGWSDDPQTWTNM